MKPSGKPLNWPKPKSLLSQKKGLDTEVAQGEATSLAVNGNSLAIARAPGTQARSSSLMIPSQPWITKRIGSCDKP